MTEKTGGPKGIGGWLILPAIGLCLNPLLLTVFLYTNFVPIFQEGYWAVLTTPGSAAYHPLWKPMILFEITGNTIFILFSIILLIFFFRKHYRLPLLFVIFLAANLFFVAIDFFAADLIPAVAQQNDVSAIKELVRSVVSSAIWIPYFLISKRVKNTFIVNKPGVMNNTSSVTEQITEQE